MSSLLGESVEMRHVRAQVQRFARSRAPVLIVGESGTGKERVARLLHQQSGLSGPFTVLDGRGGVGSLTHRLRGYTRGAFSGARGSPGLLEQARGGSFLIDGVDELSADDQRVLVGVLGGRELRRFGSVKVKPLDIRLLATSQRDLKALVGAGSFREDLYHRLAVLCIELPTLRERREDLPLLAQAFLPKGRGLSPEALRRLLIEPWRGNVRELKQRLKAAATLSDDQDIGARDLERVLGAGKLPKANFKRNYEQLLREQQRSERQFLGELLGRFGGRLADSAEALGMSRFQLARRLKKLDESLSQSHE